MKIKRNLSIFAALLLLISVLWYFSYYPLTIGSPTAVSIKYLGEAEARFIPHEQAKPLLRLFRLTTPTVFIGEPRGIGHEPALITLYYADGSTKVFSLWSNFSILYEGTSEDITMTEMLGGGPLYFGGALPEELQEIISPPHHHVRP